MSKILSFGTVIAKDLIKSSKTNSYNCYRQTTKSQCIADSQNNDSFIFIHWRKNYDCNKFCAEETTSETTSSDTCIVF